MNEKLIQKLNSKEKFFELLDIVTPNIHCINEYIKIFEQLDTRNTLYNLQTHKRIKVKYQDKHYSVGRIKEF
ncbi:MAG: hypothetical protein LBP85_07900 [Prevotellaceae bacterium]|jgi:hypothetical protein|nr:hypothetical protein [Prevotellaceae bacterium]